MEYYEMFYNQFSIGPVQTIIQICDDLIPAGANIFLIHTVLRPILKRAVNTC